MHRSLTNKFGRLAQGESYCPSNYSSNRKEPVLFELYICFGDENPNFKTCVVEEFYIAALAFTIARQEILGGIAHPLQRKNALILDKRPDRY